MSRKTGGNCGDVRQSALWGSGNRGGEFRSNALWGKGGRGGIVTLVGVLVLSLAAGAASAKSTAPQTAPSVTATVVEAGLLERQRRIRTQRFRVIVQSATSAKAAESAFDNVEKADDQQLQSDEKLAQDNEKLADKAYSKYKAKADRAKASAERDRWRAKREEAKALRKSARGELDDRFDFINGVSLEMSGRRLERLARGTGLTITEDVEVVFLSGSSYSQYNYTSKQLWAHESGVSAFWYGTPRPMPAIAIVDSGIDKNLPDFAGRNIKQVNFVGSGKPNGTLDGRGHGSFVAGIAAGSARDYAGVAPNAPLVSLDVMDDSGSGRTSDVIAATEWIFQNHEANDIKVVNYSLHGGGTARFYDDPLNKAVSKLWHAGIVVVAAAGNYGRDGAPSGVLFAPGNNPFVITVGAIDIGGTARVNDDDRAPWSAYGRTQDGFWKPEICAPGRMMVGPIPMGSTLAAQKARQDQEPRLCRALRDVVRGAGDHGYRGSDPRPEPEHDAGSGQGCCHAAGPCGAPRREQLVRRRAGQRSAGGAERDHGVQPERSAEQLPDDGCGDGADGVRRRQLDGRVLERRFLGCGQLDGCVLERRFLGCGLLERRLLDGRILGRCLLERRLLGGRG